jgi:hypothetical protein
MAHSLTQTRMDRRQPHRKHVLGIRGELAARILMMNGVIGVIVIVKSKCGVRCEW